MNGISHITFVVRDLDRMATLLCEGLGAREVYDSAGRNFSLSREKFFAVPEADLPGYRARLEALGVDLLPPRPRVEGEAQSLYFHDFDNHLFELHTGTLEQRLAAYRAR